MKKQLCCLLLCAIGLLTWAQTIPNYDYERMEREKLGRGLVAVRSAEKTITLSWRYLETDSVNVAFNVYRATVRAGDGHEYSRVKKNKQPIRDVCYFRDEVSATSTGPFNYYVVPVNEDGSEGEFSQPFRYEGNKPFLQIAMQPIEGDANWTYVPGDASVGDLDGDGEYEIVIKREPNNGKDNSQSGITGVTYLEAYKLDGTFLWRINLGVNIRSGAHYTQFMVYDFDGDGKAEVACKTADGTYDGLGKLIGTTKSYVDGSGYILEGPEYLTMFNGETGAEMATIPYNPPRLNNGTTSRNTSLLNTIWGDNYGNRCDRFLAAVAYLDGVHPSLVMCRGYYRGKSNSGRTTLWAVDWRDGKLTQRWLFDTYKKNLPTYDGQGFHNLRVGDIDGDGKDEIVYGSCTIDHDGKPYRSTNWGHGDAMHLSDIDPELPGLEVWTCHEDKVHGSRLRSAYNDKELISIPSGDDVGRCMMADIDPATRGCEVWSSRSGGVLSCKGKVITSSTSGVSMNMACWWDGKLNRNLMDGTNITRWSKNGATTVLSATGCSSNNGSKSNPCLQADIIGDWREEAIWRSSDNKYIRIYTSTTDTKYRFHCFMHEPIYRISVATQNVAYNQPTQPGFYLGSDLEDIFPQSEYVVNDTELELSPVFEHARAWKWSDGSTERNRRFTAEEIGCNQRTKIEVEMDYRGYLFRDSVFVTFQSANVNLVQDESAFIAPTVVSQWCHFSWPEQGNNAVLMSVFDMRGRLCQQQEYPASAGAIDLSSLSAGWYLIRLDSGVHSRVQRIYKAR